MERGNKEEEMKGRERRERQKRKVTGQIFRPTSTALHFG